MWVGGRRAFFGTEPRDQATRGSHLAFFAGYFEAVRVIAIFALVTFVAFFFTIGDNRHMGKGNRPTAIAIAAGMYLLQAE